MKATPHSPASQQPRQPENPPGAAARLATEYLTAFYRGEFDRARAVVAEEFSFRGPFLQVDGRDAFFAGAEGLKPIVRGHRMVRQWEDGADVCSLFEANLQTPAGTGSVLMSEWHIIRGGRLTSGRVVFDTAAFRALVPVPRPETS
jgi:predicted SnoaL-like aldol condensation-catalyzing enzyme